MNSACDPVGKAIKLLENYFVPNMKKLFSLICCLLCFGNQDLKAQTDIITTPGIQWVKTGAPNIILDGDWLNQGQLNSGNGAFLLNGTTTQSLENTSGSFNNLTIDKAGGEVFIQNSFLIEGDCNILNGQADLNDYTITFGSNALLQEAPGMVFYGDLGQIQTTRILNQPNNINPAGFGFRISSSSVLGSTIIQRRHTVLQGNGQFSIARHFIINPNNNMNLNAVVTFFYDDSELNGQTESDLKLFHSTDGGLNWDYVTSINNTTSNSLLATGRDELAMWTASAFCMDANEITQAACQDITVSIGFLGQYSLQVTEIDAGSTGACGFDTRTVSPNFFNCSDVGTQQVVTLSVTGNDGNTSTCQATVTVEDNFAPLVTCQNPTIPLDANGMVSIISDDVVGTAFDNCSTPVFSLDQTDFDCMDIGNVQTVNLTVMDDSGNMNSCQSSVTIIDDLPPVAQCRNSTRSLSKSGRYKPKVNHIDQNSSDNCGIASMTVSPTIFLCSDLGDQPITLTVTDLYGNTSSCVGIVTIVDNVTPKIRCPLPITVDADPANCDAVVNYVVQFVDNCDGEVLSQLAGIPSGGTFPIGTTINTFEVVDVVGNSKQCSFPVTVNDPGGCMPLVEQQAENSVEVNTSVEIYPNPFSHQTTIRYGLSEVSHVKAEIYNLEGEMIAGLLNANQEPGNHELVWDVRNTELAAGVYYLHLRFGDRNEVKRIVLVR